MAAAGAIGALGAAIVGAGLFGPIREIYGGYLAVAIVIGFGVSLLFVGFHGIRDGYWKLQGKSEEEIVRELRKHAATVPPDERPFMRGSYRAIAPDGSRSAEIENAV